VASTVNEEVADLARAVVCRRLRGDKPMSRGVPRSVLPVSVMKSWMGILPMGKLVWRRCLGSWSSAKLRGLEVRTGVGSCEDARSHR